MSHSLQDQAEAVIPNSDAQLRLFLRKAILFCLPIGLIGLPALTILKASGEAFYDIDQAIAQLSVRPFIIGFAYNEQNYPYLKYASICRQPRADILALGSSRVLSFRHQMFTKPFYNAGYTIQTVADAEQFLQLIPEDKLPSVLIIGLDQWAFNSEWRSQTGSSSSVRWTQNPSRSLRNGFKRLPDVYSDIARGRISVASLFTRQSAVTHVGLNGVVNDKGFRNDGSFDYGRQILQLLDHDPGVADFEFRRTLSRVADGRDRFQFGDSPDREAVEDVRRLLRFCGERNIHVVAFLPPFADLVSGAMQRSTQHGYLNGLASQLEGLFDGNENTFHDFSSMTLSGSSDSEAIDGFHAGEVTYLKILLSMLERDSRLAQYCNMQQLQHDLQSAVNPYQVYAD